MLFKGLLNHTSRNEDHLNGRGKDDERMLMYF